MKAIARSLVVILVALIAVPALAVSYTLATAVQLLATTALIMGGTQHPLSFPTDPDDFVNLYMGQATDHYIIPGTDPDEPVETYAVIYPAEFFPVFGTTTFDDSVDAGVSSLGGCLGATNTTCVYNNRPGVESPDPPPPANDETDFVVFGYSQSAVVASLVKNQLINDEFTDTDLDGTKFVMVSNPMRANGGILGRGFEGLTIPIIGITFYGPTKNSCPSADPCSPGDPELPDGTLVYPTVDVAQQYDILGGDAPARLDPLAFANSIASYALLHGNMPTRSIEPGGEVPADHNVIYQDTYGDTTYYMVTAPRLPLLMLLEQAGVPGPVLALPDALLRVWIEDKYRRDLSPGEHVPFELSPIGNPIALVGNMLGAIPVGIDDTVQQATGTDLRPLGTADVYRPFGVGGTVYDKTTGLPTTDDNVLPFNGNNNLTLNQKQAGDNQLTLDEKADAFGNLTPEGGEASDGVMPRPFERLRGPIGADRPRPFSGLRPDGEGPLKKIVNALTGQKPESAAGAETDKEPASESPAPAA